MIRLLLITCLALCLGAGRSAAKDSDKGILTRFLEDQLSSVGNEVDIRGFEGALSTRATITELTVSDDNGVWLRMQDLVLDWDRSALLYEQRLLVQELSAARMELLRRPLPVPRPPNAQAQPLRLPDLPVAIEIGAISVPRLLVGPDWAGTPIALDLHGSANLHGQSFALDLQSARQDGIAGHFTAAIEHRAEESQLAVDLDFAEPQGGILAGLLALPGQPPLALRLDGRGPLEEFVADLRVRLADVERIGGQLVLRALPEGQQIGLDLAGDLRRFIPAEAQPFFGPASTLRVTAERRGAEGFALRDLRMHTAALRLEGQAGIDSDFWPTSFDLSGEISATEGIALPLPGTPIHLKNGLVSLQYDAAQSPDWKGVFTLKDLRQNALSIATLALDLGGQIAPSSADEAGRWTLKGSYDAEGINLGDAALNATLGARLHGEINAHGASGEITKIPRLTLFGPEFEAAISGQIGRASDDYRLALTADLRASDLAQLSPLVGRDLGGTAALQAQFSYAPLLRNLSVTLHGTTQDLRLNQPRLDPLLRGTGSLTLRADRDASGTRLHDFALTTNEAHITAEADLTNTDTKFDFDAEIPRSHLISKDFSGPITATGKIRRADGGTSVLTIKANLPQAQAMLEADLAPRVENYAGRLRADLRFDDLSRYGDLVGRDLSGTGQVMLIGHGSLVTGRFDLAMTARSQDIGLGQRHVDALLAGDTQLVGTLKRDREKVLRLRDLSIVSPVMTGKAEATLAQGALTARLEADLPDASVLEPGLRGQIRLVGQAQQAENGSTRLNLHAIAPQADLQLRADIAQSGPLPVKFAAQADLGDLAPYGGLLGRDLAGALWANLDGRYSPQSGAGHVNLLTRGRDLGFGGSAALDDLLAGQGELRLRAGRDAAGNLSIDSARLANPKLQAHLRGSRVDGIWAGEARAELPDLARFLPDLRGQAMIEATARGDETGTTQLRLSGIGPASRLTGQAQIAPPEQDYASRFAAQTEIGDLRPWARLLGQSLTGRGRIAINGTARPLAGAVEAQIDARSQDISSGNPQIDKLLSGTGTAQTRLVRDASGALEFRDLAVDFSAFRLSGAARVAQGAVRLEPLRLALPDLGLLREGIEGAATVSGGARIANGRSELALDLSGTGGMAARLSGQILPEGQANLALRGALPLSIVNPILSPQALSGQAQADLSLRGPLQLDSLRGQITTSGSRLSIPQRNAALDNLTGRISLNGPRADLDLSATGVGGGQFTLRGPVDMARGLDADLRLRLNNVLLRDPALYETRIDGELTVRGPIQGGLARIGGALTLPRTEIKVPTSAIGGLTPLPEIRHLNAPAHVRRTLERAGLSLAGIDLRRGGDSQTGDGARAPIAFPLDISIAAPERIFVRGRGIDAELGGQFRLGGTSQRMIPSGRLELIRGRVNILQQRFELDDGYGALEGDFIPYIRLNAVTTRGDLTIYITVEGDVSKPKITFSSAPELPEDEVLARLLFGRELTSISPLQAVQLASAINTLAGGNDVGVMNTLRSSIGLDDLDLTASETGQAQVRAGKYLNEDIYADVTVDSEGKSTLKLNLDLSPDVTVKGSSSSSGQSSIGIFFEKDY